ncbi:MAG: hypothetical protein KAG93_05585 [Desulfuromusa sp.]|nr:hypothetical protein [Desulfuromusa sp.]
MNKSFQRTKLNNGVVVECFTHGNRYFGDFHRVEISVVVTVPFVKAALANDLKAFAAHYPDFIRYEKRLERMGVATSQLEAVSHGLIDDFLKTVSGYLEKNGFAESLLRREMQNKTKRTAY